MMKIRGKTALWFWIVLLGGNALLLYELIFSCDNLAILLISLIIYDLVFVPMTVRNYILIEGDTLKLYFGFYKDSIKISNITEVYRTHNPISSTAASLDRLVIKGRNQEIMCSVRDKETLFKELKRRKPEIKIR